MLQDIIKKHIDGTVDYTELRAQVNTKRGVSMLSGNLISNVKSEKSGVSARVYKNGVWGFAANGEYDGEHIKAVLEKAKSNADFLDRKAGKGKPPLINGIPAEKTAGRDFLDVPQKEYIDFAKELDEYIKNKYPALKSRAVICRSDSMEKLLYVSTGSISHAIMPRAYVYAVMTAEDKDGDAIELFKVVNGGAGYFTDYYTDPASCYEDIDKLYEEVMKKTEGIFPEAGICDCILDSSLAGILAHEAVGHTVEADLVMAGSVASHNLNKKVASDMVSLTDFANAALGAEAPLPLYVDDEGTACKDAEIIKDGVLVGYMNNRESAAHYGMEPQGNARAHEFSDEPLIRMRNTAILPGKSKLSDMIASIDDGYYLVNTQNGQADTTGEFMFGVTMGYEIKNGKLGRALRDTTISGVAFEMLKTVDMLSDEMHWDTSGYCGKKQLMPVAMGGPAIKCRVNIGGR
ncbi:MAG: TldD/PmbA family protein [Oscillospiraceae bacterium]|nr:TldD/PmbA family protein [Oscillospiraceae bacterium]